MQLIRVKVKFVPWSSFLPNCRQASRSYLMCKTARARNFSPISLRIAVRDTSAPFMLRSNPESLCCTNTGVAATELPTSYTST